MIQFIIQRIIAGILVLLGVTALVFFLLNIIPVDSGRLTLGQNADTATIEAVNKQLRLNYSAGMRFWFHLSDLSPTSIQSHSNEDAPLYLDTENYTFISLWKGKEKSLVLKYPYFGRSFQSNQLVFEILKKKVLPTAILASCSIILASLLGVLLGIIAALNYGKWIDNAVLTFSIMGISVPSYFSAILLSVIFGYYLSHFTHLNVTGPLIDVSDWGTYYINWKNLILPVVALGIRPVAIIMQLTRNSMLDVLGADYVRTAKAKGLSRKIVVFKHVLRNALNPVITSVTGWFAALLAGAFFVEWVFDFKGLGHETVNALLNFDFPVVMGAILFIAFIFVLINILADVLYSILDPRVKLYG